MSQETAASTESPSLSTNRAHATAADLWRPPLHTTTMVLRPREARSVWSVLQPELAMYEIKPKISAIEAPFSTMPRTLRKRAAHLVEVLSVNV